MRMLYNKQMGIRAMIGDRFPNRLRGTGAILKESWKQQDAAEAKAKPRSDHEFLPAALEIMEKPPSPGCAGCCLSLVRPVHHYADLVVYRQSRCRCDRQWQGHPIGQCEDHPADRNRLCPGDPCEEWAACRGRAVVVELDPTLAGADAAQANQGLLTAEVDRRAQRGSARHLQGRGSRVLWRRRERPRTLRDTGAILCARDCRI